MGVTCNAFQVNNAISILIVLPKIKIWRKSPKWKFAIVAKQWICIKWPSYRYHHAEYEVAVKECKSQINFNIPKTWTQDLVKFVNWKRKSKNLHFGISRKLKYATHLPIMGDKCTTFWWVSALTHWFEVDPNIINWEWWYPACHFHVQATHPHAYCTDECHLLFPME